MFDNLCEMLCEEIRKIQNKTEITAGDLETLNKLAATIKNLERISGCSENDYSAGGRRNRYSMRGRYSRSGAPEDGSRHVMRELEALYEDATTERERDAIRRCMDMMS